MITFEIQYYAVGFPFLVRFKSIKNTVISNLMFPTVDELSVAKA
jgi:hypothetical protein